MSQTPLHIAASKGNESEVQRLLGNGTRHQNDDDLWPSDMAYMYPELQKLLFVSCLKQLIVSVPDQEASQYILDGHNSVILERLSCEEKSTLKQLAKKKGCSSTLALLNQAPANTKTSTPAADAPSSVQNISSPASLYLRYIKVLDGKGKNIDSYWRLITRWFWSWFGYRLYQRIKLAQTIRKTPTPSSKLLVEAKVEAGKTKPSKTAHPHSFSMIFGG